MPSISSGRLRFRHHSPSRVYTSPSETNADLSSEMEMIDQLTHALNERHMHEDSDNVLEDEVEEYDRAEEMEACCAELRDLLGPEVVQQELERIEIAADFDVNRAVNFYFSSKGSP